MTHNLRIGMDPSDIVRCPQCGAMVDPYYPGKHDVVDCTQATDVKETYLVTHCPQRVPIRSRVK